MIYKTGGILQERKTKKGDELWGCGNLVVQLNPAFTIKKFDTQKKEELGGMMISLLRESELLAKGYNSPLVLSI